MRLFFIRHGETVDNVAQLYAGSRNSALTSHGYNQASRLGQYFQTTDVIFTHIFSSHLNRAVKTAELVRAAQDGLDVFQTPLITEQDFGSMEGKSFAKRTTHVASTDNVVPSETRDAMNERADAFLDSLLVPIITLPSPADPIIAVVSHGIFLGILWKRLLCRLPARSITLSADIISNGSIVAIEHLGGWSNTGYLEISMIQQEPKDPEPVVSEPLPEALPSQRTESTDTEAVQVVVQTTAVDVQKSSIDPSQVLATPAKEPSHIDKAVSKTDNDHPEDVSSKEATDGGVHNLLHGFVTTVERVNSKEHLKNLKRTGGGVGSAKYDENQKGIETFFKRRRKE